MALEKRSPDTTHPAQAELPAQESGDNSTKQGWMPKFLKGDSKKKKTALLLFSPKKTHLHRARVPAYTHNLMTAFDISVALRHWTDLGACSDHTHLTDMMHLE